MNSDVEMVDQSGNPKVAILDAGAQYGKVYVILLHLFLIYGGNRKNYYCRNLS